MNRIALLVVAWMLAAAPLARAELWLTDFAAARAQAARENRPVLINFSGSDWCGWCMRLDAEVFSTPAFITFAAQRLVCVQIDFPRRTQLPDALVAQNRSLKQAYGVEGYPTVLITTPQGQVIARTGYRAGGPQAYVEHLDQLLRAGEPGNPTPTENQP